MIIHQEQLGCDPLLALAAADSQPLRLLADPAAMPGKVTHHGCEPKGRADHEEIEPEKLPAVHVKFGRSHADPDPVPVGELIQDVDLRSCLDSWPYDPTSNVRIGCGQDGRQILLVRQPMGLQQLEMDGRPDGSRAHGEETVLRFHHNRFDAARRTVPATPFELTTGECAELFGEACALSHRLAILLHVKDWTRVKRDAGQILSLLELVRRHARCVEDRVMLERWHPHISRIDSVANAMGKPEGHRSALPTSCGTAGFPDSLIVGEDDIDTLARALIENLRDMMLQPPGFQSQDESKFLRQDDFWTICYHGQSAFLKSNKGLECIACLLRSPGREYHVSQLVACDSEDKALSCCAAAVSSRRLRGDGSQPFMSSGHDGTPLLDPQAKAECKRRLDDLRDQEDEAERFNDPDRAAKAHAEINAIARYLSTATGLGGRDRKTSSEAERARCAVTKRIKQAIQKIADAIPALGHHLTARIKTGYFCSYNPHPDRPVAWKT